MVSQFLGNARARVLMLNGTLVLLFGLATLVDHWPGLAVPAVTLGFVVLGAEALLLRRLVKLQTASVGSVTDTDSKSEASATQALAAVEIADARQAAYEIVTSSGLYLRPSRFSPSSALHLTHHVSRLETRLRASQAETWALSTPSREEQLPFFTLAKGELRQPVAELQNWKLVPFAEGAFNVVAGDFEIEYFHGKTNIRVLDASKVTVETASRGEKVAVPGFGVNAACYQ